MKTSKIPYIPIVGCTAFEDEDNLRRCITSGMDSVIQKPVNQDKIRKILADLEVKK